MPADTYSVSYITNTMRGAPVINGNTPGCLIAALDALLVTGWGLAAPTSINVAAGVATVQFASATPWAVGAVIEVAGAAPAALDGKARVLTSSGNTLTFATAAADGSYTATGIKYAPAGWEKVFSGTNKAVYRSTNFLDSRHYLRVDDSHNQWARVRGFEVMSDVDTGTGPFPADAQMSGGGYWHKATSANGTDIPYLLAADAQMLLVAVASAQGNNPTYMSAPVRGFGTPLALNPAGDVFATVLTAAGSDTSNYANAQLAGGTTDSGAGALSCCPRPWQGIGSSTLAYTQAMTGIRNVLSGACNHLGAGPSGVDGQLKLSRVVVLDQVANAPARSLVPGVWYIPQTNVLASLSAPFALVDGGAPVAGRKLATVLQGSNVNSPPTGVALVDVTGPWR